MRLAPVLGTGLDGAARLIDAMPQGATADALSTAAVAPPTADERFRHHDGGGHADPIVRYC
jgi:hypothetical protein